MTENSTHTACTFAAPFFSPLPNPEEMAVWDKASRDLGIPELVLMENASRAAVDALLRYAPDCIHKDIAIAVGGGNNGGDAVCMGRILTDLGARVTLYLCCEPDQASPSCQRQFEIARALSLCTEPLSALSDAEPDLLIDGLLGTGFHGPLRDDLLHDIRAINRMHIPCVVAVDIPSGLNGSTGRPSPEAIRAHLTISMQAVKVGLTMPAAAQYTGTVVAVPIGIPSRIRDEYPTQAYRLEEPLAQASLPLPHNGYKTRFGHVGIVGGGDPAHTGAAHLAARAALRTGAGLVRVIAPAACTHDIRLTLPEIMLTPLTDPDETHWPSTLSDELVTHIQRLSCLVVGPGLGLGPDAAAFIQQLLASPLRPPLVLDADALTLLAHQPQLLDLVRPGDVLTPHPGEAAALLGITSTSVQKDRQKAIASLVELHKGAVLLKGAVSLIRQKNSPLLVCPWDIPQLSIGGAGDVLSGILGALIAQRVLWLQAARNRHRSCTREDGLELARLISQDQSPLALTARAVAIHARAAMLLACDYPNRGFLAQELADILPRVSGTA